MGGEKRSGRVCLGKKKERKKEERKERRGEEKYEIVLFWRVNFCLVNRCGQKDNIERVLEV